ncbi:hypothetical protein CHLRE_13g574150v5 [Chlamydomonas reinhardtii]|uniref:L-2-hydroxyglutarate dehydrogenase, mitochondrial n=1 Tax=Chlamydomonas reinhardtii TaxID=3055 RepID=A0A2K3CZW2_CHLRE|nr:uncharacterized protein CHLRE_13g574150v5 [Chlamydomonas reinhardtii]PNW73822.1 hypothetical protein CHLRE_13g574150v5 [Chlamydomonas reinhardtii]
MTSSGCKLAGQVLCAARMRTGHAAVPSGLLGDLKSLTSSSSSVRVPESQARALATSQAPEATNVDCVVIGAGVVGLACARALAQRGQEVVVVEAAGAIGTETSSRHSEVIHAGIYYPLGSLKARLCVEGKARLYDFCRQYRVPYKAITKLIVATSKDQLPDLDAFRETAARHGVPDLQRLSGPEAQQLEPALAAAGALLSPSTGILDSHAYMAALLADAEAHGAVLALNTRVAGGWVDPLPHTATAGGTNSPGSSSGGSNDSSSSSSSSSSSNSKGNTPGPVARKVLELHTRAPSAPGGGGAPAAPGGAEVEVSHLRARWVVNAAGLHAMRVAATMVGLPRSAIPRLYLAKGNYFSLAGRCPFGRLIYPMPERGLAGLGTHLTLDMAGGARFGPDVEWLPDPGLDPSTPIDVDYKVDPHRADLFYPAIRRFFPSLPDGALQPAYSGCRPKLSGPGQPAADFMVQGARGGRGHGLRGWVNMYGIESPGLTSSLALAQHAVQLLVAEA